MHNSLLKQINHELLSEDNISISTNTDNSLNILVTLPFAYQTKQILLEDYLKTVFNQFTINVEFKTSIAAYKIKNGLVRKPKIKNMLAVTSGKGGVGKSTTAVNLALSLANNGARVGILDADIYGPSIPILVGERKFKPKADDSGFIPLDKYGIKIMSIGFVIAESQPIVWRGAMVNKALDQLLSESVWGELDYLIIDMPPGTGDIHLTMCQQMPITAVVSVTTPQDIALLDVAKSLEMYKQLGIPCIGIIENMSTHICNKCGNIEEIFGSNGGEKLATTFGLDVLAKLPLDINIRLGSDIGTPVVLDENNPLGQIYNDLAMRVGQNLSLLGKDYSSKLGTISVNNL